MSDLAFLHSLARQFILLTAGAFCCTDDPQAKPVLRHPVLIVTLLGCTDGTLRFTVCLGDKPDPAAHMMSLPSGVTPDEHAAKEAAMSLQTALHQRLLQHERDELEDFSQ